MMKENSYFVFFFKVRRRGRKIIINKQTKKKKKNENVFSFAVRLHDERGGDGGKASATKSKIAERISQLLGKRINFIEADNKDYLLNELFSELHVASKQIKKKNKKKIIIITQEN